MVYVSGNTEELGMWDINRAVPLQWEGDGHSFWARSMIFDDPCSGQKVVEYKYFVAYDDELRRQEVHWEKDGPNRVLDLGCVKGKAAFVLVDTWGEVFGYGCVARSAAQKELLEYEYERNLRYREHIKKLSCFVSPCTKDQVISCI